MTLEKRTPTGKWGRSLVSQRARIISYARGTSDEWKGKIVSVSLEAGNYKLTLGANEINDILNILKGDSERNMTQGQIESMRKEYGL